MSCVSLLHGDLSGERSGAKQRRRALSDDWPSGCLCKAGSAAHRSLAVHHPSMALAGVHKRRAALPQINLRALRAYAQPKHFNINILNSSSVHQFLPDLPPEFARLQSRVASSDVARLALLARYGGLYLDADFLVTRSLVPILDSFASSDVVAYPTRNICGSKVITSYEGISSNFLLARPRTTLFMQAWPELLLLLPRQCMRGQGKHYICCSAPHLSLSRAR